MTINSLIWLVFLIAVIAAVVFAVRAASGPRVREEPVVQQQQPVVQQQPVPTSGLPPGWYPDQHDPALSRYFDGRAWTSSTTPRS